METNFCRELSHPLHFYYKGEKHSVKNQKAVIISSIVIGILTAGIGGIITLIAWSLIDKNIQLDNLRKADSHNSLDPSKVTDKAQAKQSNKPVDFYAPKPKKLPQPFIPNLEEIRILPTKELHHLWKINNEILIGIIARENIPRFGFHGTNHEGLVGIQKSKESKGLFYIAGYSAQSLNPTLFLRDLYTIAFKASNYIRDRGGLFTFSTEHAKVFHPYRIPILNKEFKLLENYDSFEVRQFFTQTTEKPEQLFLTFNAQNYDKQVKGVLKEKKRVYSHRAMGNFYKAIYAPTNKKENNDLCRWELAARFEMQEIIFQAFRHLGVIDAPPLSQRNVKKFV